MAEKTAVLAVDMLSPCDHDDAERRTRSVEDVIDPLRDLIGRASEQRVELVYINDDYGSFNSSHEDLVNHALGGSARTWWSPIFLPTARTFVVKARHSVFGTTPLEYPLQQRGVDHLVLASQVTEQCRRATEDLTPSRSPA